MHGLHTSPAYTISGRVNNKGSETSPGRGAYDYKPEVGNGPAYSIR